MRNLVRGLIAALLLAALPLASQAGLFVSVTIAPPVLPVYYQPPIPGPGYIWTPGYWAWDDSYYWVPGTWVLAPVGLLWTPGYWGWGDGAYLWHAGYWGPHVGFYGGVNYGFGYGGVGFAGGEWRGGQLYYNRSVTNISNTNITNVYNRTVVNNGPVNHVSYNGGAGGISARPNATELSAEHERHEAPLQVQTEHRTMAAHDNSMRASVNGGRPSIAATPRAGVFTGRGVAPASGAQSRAGAFNEGRGNLPARPGGNPANERLTQGRSSGSPANERLAQGRSSGSPANERLAQGHSSGSPPNERFAQPRGGNARSEPVPQPRAGNSSPGRQPAYSQPRESVQPRGGGSPGPVRAEQPRAAQPHGGEQRRSEERPRGDEPHPH